MARRRPKQKHTVKASLEVPGLAKAGSSLTLRLFARGEKLGEITLDRAQHKVSVKGKTVDLTATEFKLLATLMERRGRVQSRDVLLNDVWSYDSLIDTRTVDTHVRRLREKLGKAGNHIETVRGFGYRMENLP